MTTDVMILGDVSIDSVSGGTRAQIYFEIKVAGMKVSGGVLEDGSSIGAATDGTTTYVKIKKPQ